MCMCSQIALSRIWEEAYSPYHKKRPRIQNCVPKLIQALVVACADADTSLEDTPKQDRQLLCWGKVGRMVRRAVGPGQQDKDLKDKLKLRVRSSSPSPSSCFVIDLRQILQTALWI